MRKLSFAFSRKKKHAMIIEEGMVYGKEVISCILLCVLISVKIFYYTFYLISRNERIYQILIFLWNEYIHLLEFHEISFFIEIIKNPKNIREIFFASFLLCFFFFEYNKRNIFYHIYESCPIFTPREYICWSVRIYPNIYYKNYFVS